MFEAHISWNTCRVRRKGICYHHHQPVPHHVKCLTKFTTYMIKVSINITYHHATAILHDTFFSIRKFISTRGVMSITPPHASSTHSTSILNQQHCWLLWIPFLQFFHHEHFDVFLRKGKDWYALLIVIFSLMWYIFYRAHKIHTYELVPASGISIKPNRGDGYVKCKLSCQLII